MEAMIRGKPAIGTAVGAIPELLADGRGIVIPKPDEDLIADSVIRMYQDSEFRSGVAKKGREYILHEYEWSRVALETVDVYRKAVLKKK
jgi:glycosyltransferase involved in cell wall biosynthesis